MNPRRSSKKNDGVLHLPRFLAVDGVLGDSLLILDPINGQSVLPFGVFPGSYFGGAKLDDYTFTKHA